MKRYKKEQGGKLELGQILYTKSFKLELDRDLCKGCHLCRLACPRFAVMLNKAEDDSGRASASVKSHHDVFPRIACCGAVERKSNLKIRRSGEKGQIIGDGLR